MNGIIPGDRPVSVELYQGGHAPQLIEITYGDGERLILRAIGRFSPRDVRILKSLAR